MRKLDLLGIILFFYVSIGYGKNVSTSATIKFIALNPNESTTAKSSVYSDVHVPEENDGFLNPNAISVDTSELRNPEHTLLYSSNWLKKPPQNKAEETFTYQLKRPFKDNSNGVETWPSFFTSMGQRKTSIDSQGDIEKWKKELEEKQSVLEEKWKQQIESLNATMAAVFLNESLKDARLAQHENAINQLLNSTEENRNRDMILNQHTHRAYDMLESLRYEISNMSSELHALKSREIDQNVTILNKLHNLNAQIETIREENLEQIANLSTVRQTTKNIETVVQNNSEQIQAISTVDGPLWKEQLKGCGGVIVSEAGLIGYKFRQTYDNNERCIWTIRANRRSKISVQLLESDFQNKTNSDFITITEFTEGHPAALLTSSRIEHGDLSKHEFKGPLIFITFFSDSEKTGSGFLLKFSGTGNTTDPSDVSAIRYSHHHFSTTIGFLSYPEDPKSYYQPYELTTFVINPEASKYLRVEVNFTDLEKEATCSYDSLSFYGAVTASVALTNRYCEQTHVYQGGALQSLDGTFIVIFRSDGSTQFKGFKFSWESTLKIAM